ncbi:MAG: sulfur oxidation c-type cytochrome SoxA [Gammaproteobacteria bacterium]|nr:sulfur oxidation c-type cytochrome SoxA [Gammaproteobacteria bacterium]
MKKFIIAMTALGLLGGAVAHAKTNPAQDLKEFRAYFFKKFPGVPLQEYANGIYGVNESRRVEWEATMEFPPFEPGVDAGQDLYNKYSKHFRKCFGNSAGKGIRQNYPYFDSKSGDIVTLEGAINDCLKKNGEKPLGWKKGKLAALVAYMASTSNGKAININVPNDKRALAWYERGKHHFYSKRGQLNLSCANCHVDSAGGQIRANILSPALGHVSHFPVYRKKWEARGSGVTGGFGTLHRRYGGCNKQVRAKPFKAQSDEYKALEYFHTYMSNGIKVNAPGVRQ